MTLGERIKKFRTAKGMSQDELAEKINVSRQAITKWENDKGVPDIDNLIKLSRIMGITLDELVIGDENNQEESKKEGNLLLSVNNVKKVYMSKHNVSTLALNGVSFSVKEQEMIAIMGSSGSGKTTLINILTGLLDPDEGEIIIEGNNLLDMPKDDVSYVRRKQIGIVFQNYNLLDSLTVRENIEVPLVLDHYYEDKEKKVREVASLMGIEQQLDKYPYEISGGQQQRVGICRAIINDSKVIFADEPTGNLDSKSSQRVMEYFQKVCIEKGTSLVMVTHDAISASYCDKVFFIKDGIIEKQIEKSKDDNWYEKIIETQRGIL